jgi:RNA polymerase sigma-70 factor (ECF subfamily)
VRAVECEGAAIPRRVTTGCRLQQAGAEAKKQGKEESLAADQEIPTGSEFMRRSALKLWPKIFAYALALVRDRHGAEDLCQEAFLRLFTMKRGVDLGRSLLPLLLTITRNLAASAARKPRALPLDEEEAGVCASGAPAGEGPMNGAARQEEGRAVQDALDRLSPDWRSVLYLRDGLGFSYREIAEVVKRSEDSVRVTLHRARQRIRELLKHHGMDERRAQ